MTSPLPQTARGRLTRAHRYLTPGSIALLYAVFGAVWILTSDRAAEIIGGPAGADVVTRYQTAKGLFFVGGSALLLFAVLRLAGRSLAASEERYRTMFERTSAVALIIDPDRGVILDANAAAAAFYGWSREQLAGKPVSEVVVAVRAARSGGVEGPPVVEEHRTAGGEVRQVEVYSGLVAMPRRPLQFAIIHDLTRRIAAERALESSEARYRTLLNEASDGVIVTDLDWRFIDVNPRACAMLGYDRAELLELRVSDLLTADELTRQPLPDAEMLRGGTVLQARCVRRKDGTCLDAEISSRLREDGLVQAMMRDIGERQRLEERLRQAQKMEAVGQLTGGIAHDLNNVLGVIIANTDLVRDVLGSDRRDLHPDLAEIRRAAGRGAEMIRKLLGFSRQSSLEIGPLDLAQAVGEIVDTLRRLLPTNITIERGGPRAGIVVRADRNALEQVLMNLATNARDAMPDGGTLHIAVDESPADDPAGRHGCVTVRDTGHGMPPEIVARVFDPFFTTKPPPLGSGLGMAMVYGLVRQQEGTVQIESTPEAGTTVTVRLPAVSSDAVPGASSDLQRRLPTGTESILLVEDEPSLRTAGSRILERLGYTVHTADNGEEALAYFREPRHPIDLVVSDIMMPQRDGRALYDALRARGDLVRFLFTTGYGGTMVAGLGEEGAPPLLRKPWTAEELAVKVREVLDEPA
jgi:PAS domain S-box-containing protein